MSVTATALTDPFIFYFVYELNLVKIMFVSGSITKYNLKRRPLIIERTILISFQIALIATFEIL